jgi:predicted TIM-barrel fold metal-dependent hydrolase
MLATKVIDSHLHIWATAEEASSHYPYAGPEQTPPSQLQNVASPTALLEQMEMAGVDGSLIVQPINHKYDHSYVSDAIKAYPDKFKGMLLHDPYLSPQLAVERLEELVLSGFVGVRFNPYLWPEGELMSTPAGCGLAVYKRCGELNVPVGVMCFKGLELHIDDIVHLISASPETVLILDHLGFCALNEEGDKAFEKLLSLARKYSNVLVKVSALFRNTGEEDSFPYDKVKYKRFDPLMEAFGADRLMIGSDFPFVLETEGSYQCAISTVKSWISEGADRDAVMGGTAERVFGKWGTV